MTTTTGDGTTGGGWNGAGARHVRFALRRQWNVLSALFLREAGMRHGKAFGLSFLAGALEPLFIIGTITMLFSVLGVSARYGASLPLFLATGVFPIYVFIHTSMRIRQPLAAGMHRVRYPIEQPLDHVIVHAVLHVLATALTAIGFFGVLYAMGVEQAAPWDPGAALAAIGAIFLVGVAMGMINSVIARLFPLWDVIWPAFARASLHFSGPYFVAAYLAPPTRRIFAINPILHGVNWFRHAFYPFYPNQLTDHGYLLWFALGGMTLGLLLLAATHNELRTKE